MDVISFVFLFVTLCVPLPLSIISFVNSFKTRRIGKIFSILISALALSLTIAAFINAVLGLSLSGYYYQYYTVNNKTNYYVYFYRHPCSWVALGLGCGAIVCAFAAMIVVFVIKNRQNSRVSTNHPSSPQRVSNAPRNMNYIEEIKQLKELLDCGALTQEEFDMKKKEVLESR